MPDKKFSLWFNNFQLHDKLQLLEALESAENHVHFEIAVRQFVDAFEHSYPVEAPYPKRVGRWVGIYAPKEIIERLMEWASNSEEDGQSSRYRTEFLEALEHASRIENDERVGRRKLLDPNGLAAQH